MTTFLFSFISGEVCIWWSEHNLQEAVLSFQCVQGFWKLNLDFQAWQQSSSPSEPFFTFPILILKVTEVSLRVGHGYKGAM